ncbi:MAG TPA: TadE/TadG family type IV pilus assembly protein [Afifellaceae bacterium]|nr:TadE/TadG family type IV pilus assembly protein [Afifellaceae bacterium]
MRRIHKDCEGASAVEFALVAPVLAALLLGGIEFGLVIYAQNAMQSVTRDAARKLAVNYYDSTAAQTDIRDHLPGWIRDTSEVDISNSAPGDPLNNVITVDVAVPAHAAGIINLYTKLLGDWTITASVAMKQEDRV